MADEQWYNNKDLFVMVQELKEDIREVSADMKVTAAAIKKYNGLRELVEGCAKRIDAIENTAQTKQSVGKNVQGWTGWVVAVITLLIAVWKVAG